MTSTCSKLTVPSEFRSRNYPTARRIYAQLSIAPPGSSAWRYPPPATQSSSTSGEQPNPVLTISPEPVTADSIRQSIRIDKWLWAARFFKTRALASKACDLGRIRSNEIEAKPARDVHVGDMLRVKNEGGEFHIEVLAISDMRGPAAVAQALYRETNESKER